MAEVAAAAGVASAVTSIAGLGAKATGDVTAAKGTCAVDIFQAERAEQAAEYGRVQANLTDATMREQLNMTLGNIESIRAAAHTDPTSPTGQAVMDWQETIGERQRLAAVGTIRAQVASDEASAAYLRQAGDFAVAQGNLQAGADILGGLSKTFAGMPGGGKAA